MPLTLDMEWIQDPEWNFQVRFQQLSGNPATLSSSSILRTRADLGHQCTVYARTEVIGLLTKAAGGGTAVRCSEADMAGTGDGLTAWQVGDSHGPVPYTT